VPSDGRGAIMTDDPLVEAWLIHDRIHRYLLNAIPDEALGSALPKCRSVADLFGHVLNVWRMCAHPTHDPLILKDGTNCVRITRGAFLM